MRVPGRETGITPGPTWKIRVRVGGELSRFPDPAPSCLLPLRPAAEPLHGVLQELAVGGEPELVLDGLAMRLDGLHRKGEFLGDLARTHAAPDHVEDLD